MHGYKKLINWGSLRETYAAALIYESGIIERFKKDNKLFLWDPFCGSGTILIEAFLLALQRPVRSIQDISQEAFVNLPFHDKLEFSEFIKKYKKLEKINKINFNSESDEGDIDIKIIGSDIAAKSIEAFSVNCAKAELNKFIIKKNDEILYEEENKLLKQSINPNIYHEQINNILHMFIGDFEAIGTNMIFNKNIYNDQKFTIFSNMPYGTSANMSDRIQVKFLYKRFGKFLRKNSNSLENVFILVNKRNYQDELNFRNLTEVKWKVLNTFDNNGIEVEFLQMEK